MKVPILWVSEEVGIRNDRRMMNKDSPHLGDDRHMVLILGLGISGNAGIKDAIMRLIKGVIPCIAHAQSSL